MPGDVEVFIPSYKEQQRDCNTYIRRSFTQKLSADDVITQSDDVTKMEYCSKYVTQSYGGGAAVIDGQVYVVGGRIDGDISDRVNLNLTFRKLAFNVLSFYELSFDVLSFYEFTLDVY